MSFKKTMASWWSVTEHPRGVCATCSPPSGCSAPGVPRQPSEFPSAVPRARSRAARRGRDGGGMAVGVRVGVREREGERQEWDIRARPSPPFPLAVSRHAANWARLLLCIFFLNKYTESVPWWARKKQARKCHLPSPSSPRENIKEIYWKEKSKQTNKDPQRNPNHQTNQKNLQQTSPIPSQETPKQTPIKNQQNKNPTKK